MSKTAHKLRTGLVAYGYFENDNNASVSVGIDGNDSDKLKLSASGSIDVNPTTVAQLSIDPAANGDVEIDPNGTGALVLVSGNFDIPVTSSSTNGVISINSTRFIHIYKDPSDSSNNLFIGLDAGNFTLDSPTNDSRNIGIGHGALQGLTDGIFNVCIGDAAGTNITTGSQNVGLGLDAIGKGSAGVTGRRNVGLGTQSLNNITSGNENTAVGNDTAYNLTSGSYNIAIGNSNNDVGDGGLKGPLFQLTTGSYNVAIGASTGSASTGAGYNYTGAESSNIVIGSATTGSVGESNTMRLGTTGSGDGQVNRCFIAGTHNVTPAGASIEPVVMDSSGQMGTQNQLNVSQGGTGATTLTDGGFVLGSGTGAVTVTAQPTNGQLPIGSTGADPVLATLSGGTGVSITNGSGSITIDTTGGGLDWSVETDAAVSGAVNRGYVTNRAGLVTITLPDTAAVGSIIEVTNHTALAVGWRIAQNAGETIYFGTQSTTTGVGGYLEATAEGDTVRLVCIVADTDWRVLSSIGNITVV